MAPLVKVDVGVTLRSPEPKRSRPREGAASERDSTTRTDALVAGLLSWFARHARDLPWRRTADPYAIWVSEIMLQQTQVKTVLPYWNRWMQALPTVQALAAASPDTLHKLWEGLGYYSRVRNLQRAARLIISEHAGKVPTTLAGLLTLPGVGRYTAGAVASIAYHQATPILDGNVIRVLSRVFAVAGNPREKKANTRLWELAQELVTAASKCSGPACSHLNQSLMELGALICLPKAPACLLCPLQLHCVAFKTGQVSRLPNLDRRPEMTPRRFVAFVIEARGHYLVRQRPAGVVNAHLWEFPNIELTSSKANGSPTVLQNLEVQLFRDDASASIDSIPLGLRLKNVIPLCIIRHSITRYRITLEARRAEWDGKVSDAPGSWVEASALSALAFASAHRKILLKLHPPPHFPG